MDFITHLPKVQGKTVILVVVDRFSKYGYFGALASDFNATIVANLFTEMVVKLHGIPNSVVFDRDNIFTYKSWKKLYKKSGTSLYLSSSYYPQSDGQTKLSNNGLDCIYNHSTMKIPKGG